MYLSFSRVYKPFVYSEPDQCRGHACNSARTAGPDHYHDTVDRKRLGSQMDKGNAAFMGGSLRAPTRISSPINFRHASAWAVSATSFTSLESLAVWYELHADSRFQPSASAANKLAWPQE